MPISSSPAEYAALLAAGTTGGNGALRSLPQLAAEPVAIVEDLPAALFLCLERCRRRTQPDNQPVGR